METKIAKCPKRGRRRIIGVSDVTCVRIIEVVLYLIKLVTQILQIGFTLDFLGCKLDNL
jgi:hypothetical protein